MSYTTQHHSLHHKNTYMHSHFFASFPSHIFLAFLNDNPFQPILNPIILLLNMQVSISNKQIKEFCTETVQMVEASDKKGTRFFAKFINIAKSEQYGFAECLEFNTEVLQDVADCAFKENMLDIKSIVSNEELVGYITEPYDCNLFQSIQKEVLGDKEVVNIFDQIIRAVYSVYMNGYWHRNLRAEHFVRVGKLWKLESLVLNEDYSKANGVNSQYLWSSKHEAPEFVPGKNYEDQDFNQMTVWNLGCILVHLIVGSHKLSNKTITDKFKGQPFSFEAIGIKSDRVAKLPYHIKELLASMLHHDPKKRMKLQELFENRNASEAVAKHAIENKQVIPPSKISVGRSVMNSKLTLQSKQALVGISKTIAQKDKEKQKVLSSSRINSVIDEEDFLGNLVQISNRIPSKQINFKKRKQQQKEQPQNIEMLMSNHSNHIRKSLQLYKSYYDQSQLLVLAIENIDKLEFMMFKEESQVKEIKMLIKYAVIFVSLINLNTLAEGFNQNRNILDLDGDQFTNFQNSQEYSAFQKFVNFKRTERIKLLDSIRQEIALFKKKNIVAKDEKVSQFVSRDFKKTNFQDIKTSYRLILKYAYDSISEQYNRYKKTDQGLSLAQRAMFVTYCLTIDKLYIKEHIPDNFKYYFQWLGKPASNYVPLNDFKDYILKAPKELLIENSRYILKKYYNI